MTLERLLFNLKLTCKDIAAACESFENGDFDCNVENRILSGIMTINWISVRISKHYGDLFEKGSQN